MSEHKLSTGDTDGTKDRYTIAIDSEKTIVSKLQQKPKTKTKDLGWVYVGKFGEIGFSIALPIIAGALIGSGIDKRFASYPKATLIGLVIGVLLSVITFIRIVQSLLEDKR